MNTINALLNQARALHNTGDIQGAFTAYQQVIDQSPNNTEALNGLGVLSLQIGKAELAESFLQRAAKKGKREPKYWNNLGLAQRRLGKHKEAIQSHNKAIKLNRQYVEAMNNLAALYIDIGRYDDAIPLLRQALRIKPDYANAYGNLGIAFNKSDQHDKAVQALEKALQHDPGNPNSYVSLATTYKDMGEFEKAKDLADAAIARGAQATHLVNALNVLGLAYTSLNHPQEAMKYYEQALEVDPNCVDVHINKGMLSLKLGDLEDGWEEYLWRLKLGSVQQHQQRFPQPMWHKEPLAGKSITVLAEQGLGDELAFANMFPDIIEEAEKCIIECDPRLISLFSRSFPSAIFIGRTQPPSRELINSNTDFKATASMLAWRYRSRVELFPTNKGYLKAADDRVAHWKEQLQKLGGKTVGICWRSGLMTTLRSRNYTQLTEWLPLLSDPSFTFINLQYGDSRSDLELIKESSGITIHDMGIDLKNDLDEVAALMCALDSVVTAATAVSAMAGALGVRTLQISDRGAWPSLGTDHLPWYPNTVLPERAPDESWNQVFERVPALLREM